MQMLYIYERDFPNTRDKCYTCQMKGIQTKRICVSFSPYTIALLHEAAPRGKRNAYLNDLVLRALKMKSAKERVQIGISNKSTLKKTF